jgi:SAM-dependent methyltransferase
MVPSQRLYDSRCHQALSKRLNETSIERTFGRQAFGIDPEGYHAARPAYPEWVFEFLRERCDLARNSVTFEIGSGTGIATRRLLEFGANPLIAVEPDDRLAIFLRNNVADEALTVVVSTFEEAVLRDASFDLGFSATAFHWLNEEFALAKVAKLLRPGAWWAMVSNVFGDQRRRDPFHEATKELLSGRSSPSAGEGDVPFALDTKARLAALERTGAFESAEHRISAWQLVLDTDQTVALYATFSNINIRPDREAVLTELRRIASDKFNGCVTRNMVTSLYVARRRS